MTMVRIVRTDGEPTTILPMPLAAACQHVKRNQLRTDRFYRAEFVEPVPLFDVVTYTRARGRRLLLARRLPLAEALEHADTERLLDENAGIGYRWRTVVRAAR